MTFSFPGRRLLCAGALLAAAAAGAEPAPAAKLLPAQSQIVFVTRQMGVPVEGAFKKFDAQVAFDPRKPEGGSVALQIEVGSASLGIPQSDAELPKAPWFDSQHFPKAEFRSSAIKALGGGRFEIAGKLTIKGSTREALVPVEITQSAGQSTASGSFTIQRLAYKIGDGEWTDTSVVADEVQVRFKLVLAGLGPL
ncbi:YceI family protein [Variovorax sp. J22P271]|uniref:YceI family protein n=1 Tax=Variovorax davisae TaxID=3053515 RepID=UPI002574E1B0|nr:YceI family protein [Variovorax sp. J22P271]MDM0036527.1 YceI family protein [Variovorax sp. J22P271]